MIWLFLISNLLAQSPQSVFNNNRAKELFQNDKTFEAKQIIQNEVIQNPNSPELKYNFGKIFEKTNEVENSIREYLSAAKTSKNPELQFQALFNAAKLYADKKDIQNGLKYYQMALDLKPDSVEVKTNIELLVQSGGGGEGQNNQQQDPQSDNKDQKQRGEQKGPQQPSQAGQQQKQRQQPKPFKSQDLTEQDVRRILEELKRQEDQIRKKLNKQKTQESPIGKDW
jgi:tetratricopeptide (TPR) repeat protein